MKGYAAGFMAALLLLLISGAGAQENMCLYVQAGMLEKAQVSRLLLLLEDEQTQWTLLEDDRTLRDLVLAGDAPDLAICSPQAVRPWAQEGMLLGLQEHIGNQQRMQRQVISQCVNEEEMFMAPLLARHRQMAVNSRLMEEAGFGYLLDNQAYPVWYPAQFYQILEEFMIRDAAALDLWPADMETGAALEALTQAIYGGMLLSEDGTDCRADDTALCAGVQWLGDAVNNEMIGYCQTREEALERFIHEETAIFIDWNKELEKQLEGMLPDIRVQAYPSALGVPVRSFDLVGVCAFASGEMQQDAQLVNACARLHEGAQEALGPRGIWQDGAVWLPALDAVENGTTLRSLFAAALRDVVEGTSRAQAALRRVQTAMDALSETR